MKTSNRIFAAVVLILAGFGAYAIYDRASQSPAERAAEDLGKAVDEFTDEIDR